MQNGLLEITLQEGDDFVFELYFEDQSIRSESSCFDPRVVNEEEEDDDDDDRRLRFLQSDDSRCKCGDVPSVLSCVNAQQSDSGCNQAVQNALQFDVADFFDDNDDGNNVVILVAVNVLLGLLLALGFIVWYSRRSQGSPTSSKNDVHSATPPEKYIVSPSYLTHDGASSLQDTISRPRDSVRSSFVRFSRATHGTQLTNLLKNRFSVSVRSEQMTLGSDVSSFDVQSYRTKVTDMERNRHEKFRSKSISLSENMTQLNAFLGFGPTDSRTNQRHWPTTPRALVKRVCNSLQVLSETEVEKLMQDGGEDDFADFSDEVPDIGLEKYLYRLVTGLNRWFSDDPNVKEIGMRSLLLCLIYFTKIRQSEKNFTLTVYNVHRLFAVTMLLAAKFTEDKLISNGYWADIAGLDMEELNELEECFCFESGFDFFVSQNEIIRMYREFGLAELAPRQHNDLKSVVGTPRTMFIEDVSL